MDLSLSTSLSLPIGCPCSRAPEDVGCNCPDAERVVAVTVRAVIHEEPVNFAIELVEVDGLPKGWAPSDIPEEARAQFLDDLEREARLLFEYRKELPAKVLSLAKRLHTSMEVPAEPLAHSPQQQAVEDGVRRAVAGRVADQLATLARLASGGES